jgi:hypothetical protein
MNYPPLTETEIRHAAQFRPGSVEVTAVVVGQIQLKQSWLNGQDTSRPEGQSPDDKSDMLASH